METSLAPKHEFFWEYLLKSNGLKWDRVFLDKINFSSDNVKSSDAYNDLKYLATKWHLYSPNEAENKNPPTIMNTLVDIRK